MAVLCPGSTELAMQRLSLIHIYSRLVNLVLYLIGILLMPMGVVMTIMSGLGAGGYDAWNFALAGVLVRTR